MISEQIAPEVMEQVRRMAGLKGYPREIEAQAELIRAACKNADRIETVRATVDAIMETADRCPYPSELANAIYERTPKKRRGCPACNWTGYEIVTINGMEGARKHGCTP